MTYKPIPEHRRRELGKLIPELTRKFKSWRVAPASGESEHAFWDRELPPGSPEELVWVIRHTRGAAGFMDPARKRGYDWPGRCTRTGYFAVCDHWPLDPIPGEPPAQPTPEGPLVDGTPVKEGDVLYYVGGYKPFVGAQIIAGKPKSKPKVWIEGFYCLDGRWIDPGTMHANGLSRTKPVIIEGRVVKPGDVLYCKSDVDPTWAKRTVERIDSDGLWFTNGCRRDRDGVAHKMTYVKPTTNETPKPKAEPLLGAPYSPTAALRELLNTPRVMDRDAARSLKDQYTTAFRDLYFSRVEERIASQMEAYRLAFDRKPVKPEAFSFDLETMRPGQIAFDRKPVSRKLFDPAVFSTSVTKEKHTMNQAPSAAQATPFNHAMLTVDTSNIVEVKTFVYGRDIATLDDDTLLNYVQSLTGAIEYLEVLNFKTPLVKLVTKIAQLKDAKAKIVDLLGGAPVPVDSDLAGSIVVTRSYGDANVQPRKRRAKAEMEAGAQGGTTPQAQSKSVPPAPPAPTQPEPSVADVDLDD